MHKLPLALLFVSATPLLAAPQSKPRPRARAAASSKPKVKKQNVAGVNVAGLDAAGRARRLKRMLGRKLGTPIVLKGGSRKVRRARRDLGLQLDMGWMMARAARGDAFVPLKLSVDTKKAQVAMKRLAPKFALKPREARIVNKSRGMQIVPHAMGQKLSVGGSIPRLVQAINRNSAAREVALVVSKQKPRRVSQDFKGITGRLATFSTQYNAATKGRTFNMVRASRAIDGTLVKPGGTFSLNYTVGERSRRRGYQAAIIFEGQRKKQGLGGGVSQVTGTLFNAALLAGLPIQTYQTHTRPVAYIPLGRDATVSWGDFDMKFKNPTGAPLYITYVVKGGTATASIFGKKTPGQKVRLKVVSKKLGPRRIEAKLYRTILRNGKPVLKQKVGDSSYNWNEDKLAKGAKPTKSRDADDAD